ncbi:hypothetical protein [Aliidiomarina quisquiliarum]|uniref:hypothetical protein n=1 Tax=Aliidiomarina quisquiliarum TaxID=2938947 RepID=UPI00208F509C|nr:hypothetical protein [Aliidiomarina quisquiliarum]MCO4321000.1 hypothetical protein [Aliidiomarina quisquiliarum]
MADGSLYFTKGSNQGLWHRATTGEETLTIPGDIFGTRYSWIVGPTGAYFYSRTETVDSVSLTVITF